MGRNAYVLCTSNLRRRWNSIVLRDGYSAQSEARRTTGNFRPCFADRAERKKGVQLHALWSFLTANEKGFQ